MAELALSIERVSKTYVRGGLLDKGRVQALSDVSLSVERGQIVGLLGPNGAGKTTLVKSVVGLVRPEHGRVTVLGRDALDDSRARAKLGYLPERYVPEPDLDAFELLAREGALFGLSRSERRERAKKLVEKVGLDPDVASRRVATYSKGQLARVGIAAALVPDPHLVLLDEPTDGLDPIGRRHVRDLVLGLASEGRAVLLNSHLLSEAERCCHRAAILDKGKLVAEGTLDELTSRSTARNEVLVRTSPAPDDALVSELTKVARSLRREGHDAVVAELTSDQDVDRIVDLVRAKGVSLRELAPRRASLEDVFVRLVSSGGLVVHPAETAAPGGPA